MLSLLTAGDHIGHPAGFVWLFNLFFVDVLRVCIQMYFAQPEDCEQDLS